MKDIVISAMLIAVGAIGLTNVDTIRHLYAGAYPVGTAQRDALERCAMTNAAFDRLDAAERNDCYAHLKVGPPTVRVLGPPSMPKDDIRREQQVQH